LILKVFFASFERSLIIARQTLASVTREELYVSITATYWRFNYALHFEPERQGCLVYSGDHTRMLLRITNYSAWSYFTFAHFKLRFDQRNDTPTFGQQRNDGREDGGCGNKRNVHDREVETFGEILQRQKPRVDALTDLDPAIGSQAPIDLIVSDIDCHDPTRAVLQQAVSETACRSAYVKAEQASGINLEMLECGF
jgi:hypothetical protein